MSTYTDEQFEAIQAVVDRVGAYQDGAPEGTVKAELVRGLGESGVEVGDADVATLTEAIEAADGDVTAADLLG